jgi:ribosomal protein S20
MQVNHSPIANANLSSKAPSILKQPPTADNKTIDKTNNSAKISHSKIQAYSSLSKIRGALSNDAQKMQDAFKQTASKLASAVKKWLMGGKPASQIQSSALLHPIDPSIIKVSDRVTVKGQDIDVGRQQLLKIWQNELTKLKNPSLQKFKSEKNPIEIAKNQSNAIGRYLVENPNISKDTKAQMQLVQKQFADFAELHEFIDNLSTTLPSPIHYKEVSDEKINEHRKKMNNFLDSLGRLKGDTKWKGKGDSAKLWTLDIDKIKDTGSYSIDQFHLTGAELKKLIQSTRVSYDPKLVKTSKNLENLLTTGGNPAKQEESNQARGRCVSSDVVLIRNQQREPIERAIGSPLPRFRIYTMNGPNLCGIDAALFINEKQELKTDEYKAEMKALLKHYLSECRKDGIDIPVIPGIGMGAFLPHSMKDAGRQAFAEALCELLEEPDFNFKQVVFADPEEQLCKAVEEVAKNNKVPSTKLKILQKSGIDVVQKGTEKGYKMAFLNPGDSSCYPGENWEKGHFALEEMLGMDTLMVLAQHPGSCENVRDSSKYVAAKIRV